MYTKDDLVNSLKKLNVEKGKPVIVHSSLKSIGEIDGGGEALLSALIDVFAENGGLLCIPSHTWTTCVMDLNKAESCIGVLPALAAAHAAGVRSMHPTHSMVVFGEKERVERFVEQEAFVDSPTNPDGCYGNIFRENGYILLIGVGQTKNTCIHCVDEMLKIPNRLTDEQIDAAIVHKDGRKEVRKLYWFDEEKIPDVSVNFGKLEPAFRFHGCIENGVLGNASLQLCSASKIKKVMELIYENAQGKELFADDLPLDESLYK